MQHLYLQVYNIPHTSFVYRIEGNFRVVQMFAFFEGIEK